jgi:hypothetical protein
MGGIKKEIKIIAKNEDKVKTYAFNRYPFVAVMSKGNSTERALMVTASGATTLKTFDFDLSMQRSNAFISHT